MPGPEATPPAVDVAGFLRGGLGLGEAARLYVAALHAGGVPLRTTTVEPALPDRPGAVRKQTEFADVVFDEDCPVNLVCVNAPEFVAFAHQVGVSFFEGRRTIGVWAWEVDALPGDWSDAFSLVDEIWVYSEYVRELLEPHSPVPVVVMPLPVLKPDVEGVALDLGIPEGFTFLFLFDFFSTVARKNPLGLIEAFKRAFAPGEGPQLVLKSHNGDYQPERLRRVLDATEGRPDIHVVDRFLTAKEKDALIAGADAYVSLHRAEGYGLTPAEAMVFGKPVVATGWSGNTDFMTPENSYLVRYGFTKVGPEGDNYPAQGTWAEPDLDDAARQMRAIWENPEEAAARGARAQADMAALSLEAVGERARARIEQVAALPARHGVVLPAAPPPPEPVKDATQWARIKASYDPLAAAREAGGVRGRLRQAILRVLKPYSHHQDEVNTAVVAALGELSARGHAVDAAAQGLRADLEARMPEPLALSEQDWIDVHRVLLGMRARPGSSHPDLSYVDEHGRRALGFQLGEAGAAPAAESDYVAFEAIFRGSEDEVRERQRIYLEPLRGAGWVLDIGSGRGEFLDLLRDEGIAARGVDLDEGMVRHARGRGHDVTHADAVAFLREQPDGSIPAAFAAQVVEHLPAPELHELLALLAVKLEPGGLAILETVNPHCPPALKAFWTDITHQHPLFPEVLLGLCRLHGFVRGEVRFPGQTGDFDADVHTLPDYAVLARTAA